MYIRVILLFREEKKQMFCLGNRLHDITPHSLVGLSDLEKTKGESGWQLIEFTPEHLAFYENITVFFFSYSM